MKLTRDQVQQISYYYQKGFSHRKIARHFGIAYGTVQHHWRKKPRKKPAKKELEINSICSVCGGELERKRHHFQPNTYICLKCRKERARLRRLEKKLSTAGRLTA